MKKENNIRTRAYIISWNNYPPTLSLNELKNNLLNLAKVEYLILGFEEGEKEHTKHIQGYVRFTNAQYFNSVRKILKNDDGTYGYIEKALGSDNDNKKYCSKQGNYIEYGKENKNSKQELTNGIFEDIINNVDYIEICKKYASYVLYHYRDFVKLYKDIRAEVIFKEQKEKEEKELENIKNLSKDVKIED